MANRTQEKWSLLIAEYRDSTESLSEFCMRNQISDSSLYYWIAKTKQKKPSPIKMLPVVTPDTKPCNIVELVMPKGLSLRFSPDASSHYVVGIIKALL
jgi:transposase-like protein